MQDTFISPAGIRLITEAWAEAMEEPPTEDELGEAVENAVAAALVFYQRFGHTHFIQEPVHVFDALTFRSADSGRIYRTVQLHLVLGREAVYIQAPEESPVDDLYEVRKLCAEASLPEFATTEPTKT